MCRNNLHVIIDCPPAAEGEPDVCDIVSEFLGKLQDAEHTTLSVTLEQVEDAPTRPPQMEGSMG